MALTAIFAKVERRLGYTRTGPGGRHWQPADLSAGVFIHEVNRDAQPKLHGHIVVPNVGIKSDGTGGTLDSRRILNKEFIFRLGQEFRDILAVQVSRELREYGLYFETVGINNGRCYQIVGIPKEVRSAFSTRRQAILAELEARGEKNPTPKQVQAAVIKTRKKKPCVIDLKELREEWRKLASAHCFNAKKFLEESRKRYLCRINHKVIVAMLQHHAESNPAWARRFIALEESPLPIPEVQVARVVRTQVWEGRKSSSNDRANSPNERVHRQDKDAPPSSALRVARQLQTNWAGTKEKRQPLDEKIARAIKRAKTRHQWFKVKFGFLYVTGQISFKTYRKYVHGEGLPKTLLGIEWQYWSGQIKLSQRIQLRVNHGHGMPTLGMPNRSRFAINFARALNQISETQRLLMLKELEGDKQRKRTQRSHRIRDRLTRGNTTTRDREYER